MIMFLLSLLLGKIT